jgi:N-acetylmuramoyl-L-alanine amidase
MSTDDYELIDSGCGRKLERFGRYVVARPCAQALWRQKLPANQWSRADASFDRADGNRWNGRSNLPKEWNVKIADIAFRLSAVLTEMGFEVTMTRKTDAGLYGTTAPGFKKRDMQRRKEIIQDVSPLLVLSVHQNYYPSQSQRGGQVFYGDTHPNGKVLASCVQSKLNDLYTEQGVKNRVESKGDFFMLRCADCPSLIVECGFLSNPQDEALLSSVVWQESLARCIAAGVATYLERNAA